MTSALWFGSALAACSGSDHAEAKPSTPGTSAAGWRMPAEESPHERTWMCWPSSREVWAEDLPDVQLAIARIAAAIGAFEPVSMLVRSEALSAARKRLGGEVSLVEAPVDDLWARDTLPNFVVRPQAGGGLDLGATHARFNGWGGKQTHAGDAQLAGLVAGRLGISLIDAGLTGEGGGLEVDGVGTVLVAASSWVNANRNPGLTRDQVELRLMAMVGVDRVLWIDGLAGYDITDGHIDTLARFVGQDVILIDVPALDDPDDPWVEVAERTARSVRQAKTREGEPYEIAQIVQPENPRGRGEDFLATYMNYYVCNGGVIAPEFGDGPADADARAVLTELFPDRRITMVNIDPLAAGGGGIHCATQQQPRV